MDKVTKLKANSTRTQGHDGHRHSTALNCKIDCLNDFKKGKRHYLWLDNTDEGLKGNVKGTC